MALRFRTRLNLTITALVFLVVAVMTCLVLVIFGFDMWMANWRAGAVMTTVTTSSIEHAMSLPPEVQERIEDQMVLQGLLAAELAALSEDEGEPSTALSERIQRALSGAREATKSVPEDIAVADPSGQIVAGADAAGQDALDLPLLRPGEAPRDEASLAEESERADVRVYTPLPHRNGAVAVTLDRAGMEEILEPFSLREALDQFMVGGQYKRMAVIDAAGTVLAQVSRSDVPESPQIMRTIVRFCTNFLANIPEAEEERFETTFIGRDVGVVTPLNYRPGVETVALYVEHDTAQQWQYVLDRIGVLVTVGFLMFMFAMVVSIFLSRGLSKPLTELARGAREFGAGNLNYRLRMKRKDEFNDLAQSFNTMAISIQEYVHELRQETARRERLESEFRIAAEMQRTLLPEAPPKVEGLKLLGWSQPSREVGGDFYDYFEMPSGKVAVVLGDATGKGLSAALLSTQCSSVLRTFAGQDLAADELLRLTNNEFFKRIGSTHRFVTLLLMIIDVEAGTATYASAGHPPPLLTNPGSEGARWLESEAGYPLGIVKDATFSSTTIELEPRDTIVIYSDGLTDAQNEGREMFGEERVERCVRSHAAEASEELLDDLRADATRHMAGKEPIDDMTVVVVRYHPLVPAAMPPA